MKVKCIKPDAVVEGLRLPAHFIGALQYLGVYLRVPQTLAELSEEDEQEYLNTIEPYFILLNEIQILMEKQGLIEETELPDEPSE